MKLCLITDDLQLAREAETAGIDRIMLDLERDGKAKRQAGQELFLSTHRLESVATMARTLTTAELVVRVNPLSARSGDEIDAVAAAGADLIMLPYFADRQDVRRFVGLVGGRSGVVLLIETRAAAEQLDEVVDDPAVDEAHIGLNDLMISLGAPDIFEPLRTGMIERMTAALRRRGLPFGFGGIARLSRRDLPIQPVHMLAEQLRLGASRGWLGRSFRADMERSRQPGELAAEVAAIREAVAAWRQASDDERQRNRRALDQEMAAVGTRSVIRNGIRRAP